MHNATTKQRLSALRRRLGIFTGWQPRWVREKKERRERIARSAGGSLADTPAATSEATTVVASPATLGPEHAPAPTPRAAAPAAPEPTAKFAPTPAAAVTSETAAAGPWYVSRPPAPSGGARGGAGRIALAAVLAAIAIAVVIRALVRDAPAPRVSAAGDPAGLERAAGLDTRVAVAAPAAPFERAGGAGDATTVEVRRGDCLWRIAAAHLGDPLRWPELQAANAGAIHDPDLIFPGQRLRMPDARL